MGDIIHGDIETDCREIATQLAIDSVVLYISSTNGKTILGTSLEVDKPNTRVHTILYLEEFTRGGAEPETLNEEKIFSFFQRVKSVISELGYTIQIAESESYFWYFINGVSSQNEILKKAPSMKLTSPIIIYSVGRMLYNTQVVCSSKSSKCAVEYLLLLQKLCLPILDCGYSFAIAKSAVKGVDVTVAMDNDHSFSSDIDIDNGVISSNHEYANYYSNAGVRYYSKTNIIRQGKSKHIDNSSKLSLSTWAVSQEAEMIRRENPDKSNFESYYNFLNAESITYDTNVVDIPKPVVPVIIEEPEVNKKRGLFKKKSSATKTIAESEDVLSKKENSESVPKSNGRQTRRNARKASKQAKIAEKERKHKSKVKAKNDKKTAKSRNKAIKEFSKQKKRKSKLKWLVIILIVLIIIAGLVVFAIYNKESLSETISEVGSSIYYKFTTFIFDTVVSFISSTDAVYDVADVSITNEVSPTPPIFE